MPWLRAIDIVERALDKYGAPVHVRHEIVHNRHVVSRLEQKGARFVDELDEIPEGAVTVLSAHSRGRSNRSRTLSGIFALTIHS